jgi:hypothetical protein
MQAHDICDVYVHQLNAALAYAPLDQTVQAVESVLRGLDVLEAYIAEHLSRILDHPRYLSFRQPLRSTRPDVQLMNLILYRFLSLPTLWATQVALTNANAPVELLDDGRRRIQETLNDLADLSLLDMVPLFSLLPLKAIFLLFVPQKLLEPRPALAFLAVMQLVISLDVLPASYLSEWAATSSTPRDKYGSFLASFFRHRC